MEEKMLPCPSPWCKSNNVRVHDYASTVGIKYCVLCNTCGLRGPRADSAKAAAVNWNTRPLPPEQQAVQELMAILEECREMIACIQCAEGFTMHHFLSRIDATLAKAKG